MSEVTLHNLAPSVLRAKGGRVVCQPSRLLLQSVTVSELCCENEQFLAPKLPPVTAFDVARAQREAGGSSFRCVVVAFVPATWRIFLL